MEAAGVGVQDRFMRAGELLGSVGLGDRLRFRPAQLSGGQRQRVAIARAVANSPSVLLADEPTGELHSDDKARVLDLFRSLNGQGRTVVIVTHDPEVAAVAARQIEMRDGNLRG
jgi:putative ABC transport system ATP-binding protein